MTFGRSPPKFLYGADRASGQALRHKCHDEDDQDAKSNNLMFATGPAQDI
jgi:hypothetical protein